jgi:hypothetical protein
MLHGLACVWCPVKEVHELLPKIATVSRYIAYQWLAFFWASFSKLRILVPRNQQSVFFEAIPACASRREKASEAL